MPVWDSNQRKRKLHASKVSSFQLAHLSFRIVLNRLSSVVHAAIDSDYPGEAYSSTTLLLVAKASYGVVFRPYCLSFSRLSNPIIQPIAILHTSYILSGQGWTL